MAGESNLEKVEKAIEAQFGAASPLGGTMDHSMLEKSPTNKLIFDGPQAQLDLSLRGTRNAMVNWENTDLVTGKHKNFRVLVNPLTQKEETQPIWIDNHKDIMDAVGNVENAQLTCGGYSRDQFLGQIATMGNLATPLLDEPKKGFLASMGRLFGGR